MRPRNLYYHALFMIHTALLLVVAVTLWAGNRRSTLATRREMAELEKRLRAVVASSSSVVQTTKTTAATPRTTTTTTTTTTAARSDWSFVPPRVLGSGRSRSWAYIDVSYGDGATRRHFVRTNSTPREVKSFVRSLSEESARHSWVFVGSSDPPSAQ